MSWFNVDKAGLAAILERRGKFFAIAELVSNAWDSGSERVEVRLEPLPGVPYAKIEVEDWGEGFFDLDHANTMFAKSSRAGDASKRGRFNYGEKLVLAICRTAKIVSTSGGREFHETGVSHLRSKRESGTLFTAEIRMTRDEYEECCDRIKRLIPPLVTDKGPNGVTTFNGRQIMRPELIKEFTTNLHTEGTDEYGELKRFFGTGVVQVFESTDGTGEILELGIPVVESDNGYRVNVLQKVPLNMERDNVTFAFRKGLQAALLNNLHEQLTPEAAAAAWAQEAAGDARATKEAVQSVIAKRFGDHAVVASPNDPIANARAAASGFTVIHGGTLSGDVWANVRKHELLTPAGSVFPTPKPDELAKMREDKCPLCGK